MLDLESRQTTIRDPSVILILIDFFFLEEVNTYSTDLRQYNEFVADTYWA